MIASWPCPGGDEQAHTFDRGRAKRLLILPAWFDEANKLRHFTVQTMRLLDAMGADSFLPDLPGCNESLAPLSAQTLSGWKDAAAAAASHFRASHVLAIRAGVLLAPDLPGWRYAPASGPQLLRAMIRARLLASKEASRSESREELMAEGRGNGLILLGYPLGPEMLRGLETADLPDMPHLQLIAPSDLGGPGLWLRAEPGHDQTQAHALAAILAA